MMNTQTHVIIPRPFFILFFDFVNPFFQLYWLIHHVGTVVCGVECENLSFIDQVLYIWNHCFHRENPRRYPRCHRHSL